MNPGEFMVRARARGLLMRSCAFALAAVVISCGGGGESQSPDSGTPQGTDSGTQTDTTPPTIASTSPADHATNVPVNTTISVTFSEPISVSFPLSAVSISPAVTGTISVSGTTGTLTPSAPLAFSTTYTATIRTAVKELA